MTIAGALFFFSYRLYLATCDAICLPSHPRLKDFVSRRLSSVSGLNPQLASEAPMITISASIPPSRISSHGSTRPPHFLSRPESRMSTSVRMAKETRTDSRITPRNRLTGRGGVGRGVIVVSDTQFLLEIVDCFLQSFVERDFRLPGEVGLGERNVGAAHLGIVCGQGTEDKLAAASRHSDDLLR